MLKIGITGHMNLKEAYIPDYKNTIYDTLKSLKEKHGDILIYSALADGADRIVVEVAIVLGIDYIAVLPMEQCVYKVDFNAESKGIFNTLLDNALTIIEMPLVNNNTISLISTDLQKRSIQYEAAGRYISDSCDVLMALWDGKYTNLRGGTSEIVKYYYSTQNYTLYHLLVARNNDLIHDMIEFKIYAA